MIMFLVLNTTGLTLIPISVMVYRAQLGAANPTDVFIPILIATYFSSLAGLIAVCIKQAHQPPRQGGLHLAGGAHPVYLRHHRIFHPAAAGEGLALFELRRQRTAVHHHHRLPGSRIPKKINVYDAFIDGAKEGFKTAVTIIPYLVAMLVAIAIFGHRAPWSS